MTARVSLVGALIISAFLLGCMEKQGEVVANCKQSLLTPDIRTSVSLFDGRNVTLSGKLKAREYVAPPGSYDMTLLSNLGDFGIQEEAGATLIKGLFLTEVSEACLTGDELKEVELSRLLPQDFNDSSVTITGVWWRSGYRSGIIIDPASVTLASGTVINDEPQRYSHLGKGFEPRVASVQQSEETLGEQPEQQLDVCPQGADCFERCYAKTALDVILKRKAALERAGRRMTIERAMEIAIMRNCSPGIIPVAWFDY